jgi:hypothetical protein
VLELGSAELYTEPEEEIVPRLLTDDPELSADLLDEATEMTRRQKDDAESFERRAATLQGAVAIATTLTITGGALLLDKDRIASSCWRIAFASLLAATIVSFVISGVRALGASSRTHPWSYPGYEDMFDHARLDLAHERAARTASLLKAAGLNLRIIQLKGGYLNSAVFWFRLALLALVGLAALLLIYAIVGS